MKILIIARTDAIAVEGFGSALDRQRYLEAGADVLFIEALRIVKWKMNVQLKAAPLLANMVEVEKHCNLCRRSGKLLFNCYFSWRHSAGCFFCYARIHGPIKKDWFYRFMVNRMFDFRGFMIL